MQLINSNIETVQFEGPFKSLIGNPSLAGAWLIWGQSGNGKTHFMLQLMKYLTRFDRVAFNSLEEGISASLKMAFEIEKMQETNGKLILLDKETMEDLANRLRKRKSPNIIAIDSLQYTGINYRQYKALKEEFPKKLFLWISHADGKLPEGRIAKKIRYDVDVKIRVAGFRAYAMSRYSNMSEPYVIWKEGAEMFEGKSIE